MLSRPNGGGGSSAGGASVPCRRMQPFHSLVALALFFVALIAVFRPYDSLFRHTATVGPSTAALSASGAPHVGLAPVPRCAAPTTPTVSEPPARPATPAIPLPLVSPQAAPLPVLPPVNTPPLVVPSAVPIVTARSDAPPPASPSTSTPPAAVVAPSVSPCASLATASLPGSNCCRLRSPTSGGGGGAAAAAGSVVGFDSGAITECRPLQLYWYDPLPHVEAVGLEPARAYYSVFTQYLRTRVNRTFDASRADYFVVPINLIFWQTANRAPPINTTTLPHLAVQRDGQRHVLLSFGDFCQRHHNCRWDYTGGGRAYKQPYAWLDHRFALVTYQSVDDLLPAVDYALWPFVLRDQRTRPDPARRDLLYTFAGSIDYWYALPRTHIRGGRLKALQRLVVNHTDVYVGETDDAKKRFGAADGHHIYLFQRSVFVLCPAGFGRWTFRQAEAVLYGAIPVFIADGYVKPYAQLIDWERASITIPEADLETTDARLRAVTPEQVAAYQRELTRIRPLLTVDGVLGRLVDDMWARRWERLS